jgi:hypothetical protein
VRTGADGWLRGGLQHGRRRWRSEGAGATVRQRRLRCLELRGNDVHRQRLERRKLRWRARQRCAREQLETVELGRRRSSGELGRHLARVR